MRCYYDSMQGNIFRDWLLRRKITESVIEEFGVMEGNHFMFGECLVIPVCGEDGSFLFNKYRRSPLRNDNDGPKYIYDKGSKAVLYGYHRAKSERRVLLTEGELDCLVAWSANIPAISSTGGAMTFKEEWAESLKDKEVVICLDNDAAGGEGMARVLDMVPHARILFLPDRPGIKDISDYAQAGGDLNELLKTAIRFGSLEDVIANRSERVSVWQSTHFHDAYIRNHTNKEEIKHVKKNGNKSMVSDKVMRAKEYPIDELIEFSMGKARCLWHNEKHASLHHYKDGNRVYCFGMCGKSYDSIDVYMALHGCGFKEAVEKLQ